MLLIGTTTEIYAMFVAAVLLAFILDRIFGEPSRFHPLVGFGRLAIKVEAVLNRKFYLSVKSEPQSKRICQCSLIYLVDRCVGVLGWLICVVPFVWLAYMLQSYLLDILKVHILQPEFVNSNIQDFDVSLEYVLFGIIGGLILYLAVGGRSLIEHAENIARPLQQGNITQARQNVGLIVSRDTSTLTELDISKAATESVLENGADAIFSAVFWFLLGGLPAVILYRLSNTLDAMWGYKNEKYLHFGWAAARMDDVLNIVPARLTALSYALMGKTRQGLNSWYRQGKHWKSPNAGPVMSAGAGALGVQLGGAAQYNGTYQQRPILGIEKGGDHVVTVNTIFKACRLINRVILLWCFLLLAPLTFLLLTGKF